MGVCAVSVQAEARGGYQVSPSMALLHCLETGSLTELEARHFSRKRWAQSSQVSACLHLPVLGL